VKLVTEAFVRQRLRDAAGGARVEDAAVAAAVAELEAAFESILHRVRAVYARECEIRRIHGIHPRGRVREDHVTGTTRLPPPQEGTTDESPEVA